MALYRQAGRGTGSLIPFQQRKLIAKRPGFRSTHILRRLFFNLWYYRRPPWDTGISPPELLEFIRWHPPARALDLGCGTGTNAITLAKNGWRVIGIDFAPRAIQVARRKARNSRVVVDFRVGDVTRLERLSGPFELVLDIGCFHSLSAEGKATYTENLARLLAPGGAFLMYAFFKSPSERGSGLLDSDMEALCSRLQLLHRQDGSERRLRPSAWFTFQKCPPVGRGTGR